MMFSIHVAGWTLVHFVWQGALLGVAAATALRLLRSASAQTRYVVGCGALAVMLAAPIITARRLSMSDLAVSPSGRAQPVSFTAANTLTPIAVAGPAPYGVSVQTAWRGVEALLPLLVLAWLIGVAFLLLRLAGGWWRVRRLQRDALAMASSRWRAVSEQVASRLRLHRDVHVVDSPFVDTTTALGWLRPVVLLPIAGLTNLTPAQIEGILAHELAHIRRHDYLVNLLQTVAETLLFYHPAVWWVSARMRAEREHCCDDVALEVCGDALSYAAALAKIETSRTSPAGRTEQTALALAATGGSLLGRVRRMLRVPVANEGSSSSAALTTVMLLLLMMVAGGRQSVVGIVHTLAAQTSPSLAFEAASIKPNNSTSPGRRFGVPGDRFVATNETLWQLIAVAYGAPGFLPQPLANYQISGGPKWIDSDRFDVEAKAAGDVVRGTEGTRRKQLMLQTLLAQRFKLAVRHEMRDMPVYGLVLGRRDRTLGPKLRRSEVDCAEFRRKPNYRPGPVFGTPAFDPANPDPCSAGVSIEGILKGGMTTTELTLTLSKWLDRTVLDRTGLTGAFDVELQFSWEGLPGAPGRPPGVERPPNDNPSIFTAVQEQLGLKLESTRGPVDILVIDHAEKPTEN